MSKKKWGPIIVLLVIGIVFLAGCGSQEAQTTQAAEEKPVPVEVVSARQGEVNLTNTYQGVIQPEMDVNVIPKMGGKVESIGVKIGDYVNAGDVLIKLDTTEIAAQVAQAEAGYQAAKAQLEKVKAGTRSEQLEQSKAGQDLAQAQFDAAKSSLDDMRYLFEQGAVSQKQVDQAETQLKVAEAQLQQAKESLLMAQNGATAADVQSVEAQVAQAEAGLNLAHTQLDNAVIKAPISGIVSSVAVDPGEMAGPSMPVAVINQLETVVVNIGLPEQDVNRLQEGQTVEVMADAASDRPFTGEIENISPVADARSKTFQAKVTLENKKGILKAGMSAVVKAVVEKQEDVVAIPVQALLVRGDRDVVFVVDGEQAKLCPVTLGLQNSQEAAVTSGLSPGDEVVIVGQHSLEDGSKVTVTAGGNR